MNRKDPYGAFLFRMEIGGMLQAGFSEISGLNMKTEVETLWEGGINDFPHKLPKISSFGDIILKRGLFSPDLFNWHYHVTQGTVKRKNATIKLLDESGNTRMRWNLFKAFPIAWEGPAFNAESKTIAMESLTLVHEGIQLMV